jgi:hypothetical protein
MSLLILLKATSGGGGVPVGYRSSSASGTSDAFVTSINIPVPAGAAANDIALLVIEQWESANPTITWPSGFTQAVNFVSGSSKLRIAWKRLTGSDSGNYTPNWTGSQWTMGHCILITGAATTGDPIEATNTAQSTGTSLPATSVTTTTQPFLAHFVSNESAAAKTPPTNFTEVQDGDYLATNYRIPGTTGTHSVSGGSTTVNTLRLVALVAVKAADPGGGQSATVSQASETDTATALGERKLKAVAQASSTDTAAALTRRKSKIVAQAVDTSAATSLTATFGSTVGQAMETDTGTAIAERKIKALLQASETSTATAPGEVKRRTLVQAAETDTATALAETKRKTVNQAAEADTSTPIGERKTRGIAQAVETDTARDIIRPGQVARAVETDTAQPFGERKTKTLAQASEAATAQAFTARKVRAVIQAVEAVTAAPVAEAKRKAFAQALVVETATPLLDRKSKTVGQAGETDTARAIAGGGQVAVLERATETDTATVITPDLTTSRPNTGTTGRPGSGTTARPFTGVTARP